MRSEIQAPIEQRYLLLEGKVSQKAMDLARAGLPSEKPANSEILFVSFAYADLPIGKEYEIIFENNNPTSMIQCISKICAVTQPFGKPFTEIPHGWKTICIIEFPEGLQEMIQSLPVVDSWHFSKNPVCICNGETWSAINYARKHAR
jgi:hypothetical protein